ncbi:hypothetical protein [Akkermansia sp.]|uniref:hypothetical protein n=1 Tax=Akkermansia sp. TaxID=1872421 RepID=UPI00258F6C57|nr:hypothetical protein [Akkermansia sp.]MCC8093355.1 hypothetical protein [Akkermansia sp.]
MSALSDYIKKELEQSLKEIQASLSGQKINASGRSSEGFRVRVSDTRAQLYYTRDGGGAPLSTLEQGRPAGAVPRNFTEIIEQWSRDKGLHFTNEKERRRFAGAVAYGKIKRFGYGRPAPAWYGSRTYNWTPVVDAAADALKKSLPWYVKTYLTNLIYK